MKFGLSRFVLLVGLLVVLAGCGREKIEAINLANEGTTLFKQGAYDAAVEKLDAASRLDPSNHRIIYGLARAYEQKEEWENVSSTLARAISVAPTNAMYLYTQGYALVQVARKAKQRSSWEEAKEPLMKCVQADPRYSDCYFELGWTMLFLDDEQSSLENFSKAIQHAPNEGSYYAPLVDLYIKLDRFAEAKAVAEQGAKFAAEGTKARFNMYVLLATVHQATKDMAAMVEALETANRIGGAENPEILFNLGSTYAVMDPPKKAQAAQMLKQFQARACKSASAQKYKDQCEQTAALLVKVADGV